MTRIDRRSAMLIAPALAVAPAIAASRPLPRLSLRDDHVPVPLPFDPTRLDGLSERLIRSHWENNYAGSVKALNSISSRIRAALADKDMQAPVHGALKREHLLRTNSVVLHELYFGQLGGNGRPAGPLRDALGVAFGSFDNWETDFRRTAMSLAGGSGWCILAWNPHFQQLENYWSPDHLHSPVGGVPLIALDMYEHSFQMDYGAAAAKYVDAFMRNLNWEVAEWRYTAVAG